MVAVPKKYPHGSAGILRKTGLIYRYRLWMAVVRKGHRVKSPVKNNMEIWVKLLVSENDGGNQK